MKRKTYSLNSMNEFQDALFKLVEQIIKDSDKTEESKIYCRLLENTCEKYVQYEGEKSDYLFNINNNLERSK